MPPSPYSRSSTPRAARRCRAASEACSASTMVGTLCAVVRTLASSGSQPSRVATTRTGSRPSASRTVSSGSSRRTVPAPTSTASTCARSSCTARRLSRQLIQRASPPAAATLPSSVIGGLVRHLRQPAGMIVQERRVLPAGARRPRLAGEVDLHAGVTQPAQAAPGHERVGVFERDHRAADAGRDERVRARRREAVVAARLEGAVERRAAGAVAGLPQREGLGVRLPHGEVRAGPDHGAVLHENGTHERVGVRPSPASFGQVERLLHVPVVVRVHEKSPEAGASGPTTRVTARRCFSHPDCDRRPRNLTWSTPRRGLAGCDRRWGLSPRPEAA